MIDHMNSGVSSKKMNKRYAWENGTNNQTLPPDYSSDILLLQGKITSLNARIDEIDITILQKRVSALKSQITLNRKEISDICPVYSSQFLGYYKNSIFVKDWVNVSFGYLCV
jgi:hypothetical protein